MVGQNEKPSKSRVIAGTPMYRYVNKVAFGLTSVVFIYHFGVGYFTHSSDTFEENQEFFTSGETQSRNKAGLPYVVRVASSEDVKQRFLEELEDHFFGKLAIGLKNLFIGVEDALVTSVKSVLKIKPEVTETSSVVTPPAIASEEASK